MRHDADFLRLAGLAALAAAALRLTAINPQLAIPGLRGETLYFAVDLLITLGLLGMFCGITRFRTLAGAAGFVGALAGVALIRTGERLGGEDAYQRAGLVLIVSLAVAGWSLAARRGLIRYVGLAWLASPVVGALGQALRLPVAQNLAVILFCLGLGLGGVVLTRGGDRQT
jgi:hypothetical protein